MMAVTLLIRVTCKNTCQCFDAKAVTATLVSASTFPDFPWILRGVDC